MARYCKGDIGDAWIRGERGAETRSGNFSVDMYGNLKSYWATIGQLLHGYAIISDSRYSVTTVSHENIGRNDALRAVGGSANIIRVDTFGPWAPSIVAANVAAQIAEAYERWNLPQGEELTATLRGFESAARLAPREIPVPRLETVAETARAEIYRVWYAWRHAYVAHERDNWYLIPKNIGAPIARHGLTASVVMGTRNAEIRRIGLEALGGMEAVIASGAAREIHRDDWGTLYRIGRATIVSVVNSTPEPDGTWKNYILEVHPELRPLPYVAPNQFRKYGAETGIGFAALPGEDYQRPQTLTARNAVASTFGLRGEDYSPAMET